MSNTEKSKMISPIHLIGIAGIGMSGLALLLKHHGKDVQGSDISGSNKLNELANAGIKIFKNHNKLNVQNAKTIVISSAIKNDNPELQQAKKLKIPIIKRIEAIAQLSKNKSNIAISGSHGKTTTTAMIDAILSVSKLDFSSLTGGVICKKNSNVSYGNGKLFVIEADESDGSFNLLPADIRICTNIEAEHMNYFKDEKKLKNEFAKFILNSKKISIVCIDDKTIKEIIKNFSAKQNKSIITYGVNSHADACIIAYKQLNQQQSIFSLKIKNNIFSDIILNMLGMHNVMNATAAITCCLNLGISIADIKNALANFQGIKRRFSIIYKDQDIEIVDDYAHHPTEIAATINIAKSRKNERLIGVLQPHRYSRLTYSFKKFVDILVKFDELIVLPVFEAGENNQGIDSSSLIKEIKLRKKTVYSASTTYDIFKVLDRILKKNDLVVFLGAGSVSKIAYDFVQHIKSKTTT